MIPLETRAEAAWHLIDQGADPYATLHAALWPQLNWEDGEAIAGFCKRGHALTEDNIYVTKQGWKRCRECRRFDNKQRGPRTRRKEPCVVCGKPATAVDNKGSKEPRVDFARCRECFYAQRREARRKARQA